MAASLLPRSASSSVKYSPAIVRSAREGNYDLIVTGTSQARGLLRHYIMGDLTRSILNRANVPVLVARAGPPKVGRTLWRAIKGVFGKR